MACCISPSLCFLHKSFVITMLPQLAYLVPLTHTLWPSLLWVIRGSNDNVQLVPPGRGVPGQADCAVATLHPSVFLAQPSGQESILGEARERSSWTVCLSVCTRASVCAPLWIHRPLHTARNRPEAWSRAERDFRCKTSQF